MKIGVYYVESTNASSSVINLANKALIERLSKMAKVKMELIELKDVKKYDLVFDFIGGGGTEGRFLEVLDKLPTPVFLLTTGENNSLAASMEILSYLHQNDISGEIIHGSEEFMAKRIKMLATVFNTKKKLNNYRVGRVGVPSDWLIASEVDPDLSKQVNGIEIVDVAMSEFMTEIKKKEYEENKYTKLLLTKKFPIKQLELSLYIYGALKRICKKYKLNAVTVRCFDLLGPIKSTGCTALAILNAEGIYAGCEGDTPTVISMATIGELTGEPVFMANPSRILTDKNEIVFAHCTLPLNMPNDFTCMTHFESNIGVAFRGYIEEGPVTIFKSDGLLNAFFVSDGRLCENLTEKNLCRTQIKIALDKDVNYFLTEPIGNHHCIVKGNHSEIVNEFFKWF